MTAGIIDITIRCYLEYDVDEDEAKQIAEDAFELYSTDMISDYEVLKVEGDFEDED